MQLLYFQSGYCYINGTCIQSGTFKSNDSCLQCLASSNVFDWTFGMYDPLMYIVSQFTTIPICQIVNQCNEYKNVNILVVKLISIYADPKTISYNEHFCC